MENLIDLLTSSEGIVALCFSAVVAVVLLLIKDGRKNK